MMSDSFLRTHPRWSAVFLLAATISTCFATLELAARWLLAYEPSYYTATSGSRHTKGTIAYPYGVIKVNALGFPDDEFDLGDAKPRIGYFGDSVTFGVGAGYGYRVTEVLERYYPTMQHMNLSGGLGTGITAATTDQVLSLAAELRLRTVVYLLNLNDIAPGSADQPERPTRPGTLAKTLEAKLDMLRGKSYLYTWARNAVKSFLLARGFGVQGTSYELYPQQYGQVIAETAGRINDLARSLRRRGVDLIVVVLPYEMQISREAERVYRKRGVRWGSGFIEGLTQRKLIDQLRGMRTFNAIEAFVSAQEDKSRREFNRAGQYFVHDRGGRLDWNHPERAGHRRIAEYLVRSGILGPPAGLLTTVKGER